MSFTIQCQQCGQSMSAEESWVGQSVTCIQCQSPVLVQPPAAGSREPAAATPPGQAAQPNPAPASTSGAQPAQPNPTPAPQAQPAQPDPDPDPAPQAQPAQPSAAAAGAAGAAGAAAPQPRGGRPQKGKQRRTFVADWAQDMAEQWAEDHDEDIASDQAPSRAMLTVSSILTILLGLGIVGNAAVLVLLYLGAMSVPAGYEVPASLLVVGIIMAVGGLLTLVAGVLSLGARMSWVGAGIGLSILWALLSLIGMLSAGANAPMQFKLVAGGIIGFCCLTAAMAALGRSQAYRYNIWLERQQRLARGQQA